MQDVQVGGMQVPARRNGGGVQRQQIRFNNLLIPNEVMHKLSLHRNYIPNIQASVQRDQVEKILRPGPNRRYYQQVTLTTNHST